MGRERDWLLRSLIAWSQARAVLYPLEVWLTLLDELLERRYVADCPSLTFYEAEH